MRPKPSRKAALAAVRTLISFIGEDPDRPGLVGTPERVVRAWEEDWGCGYQDSHRILQGRSIRRGLFPPEGSPYTGILVVRNLSFVSHCEHHMAPFHGTVDIAYIPREGAILGLSKFARVVTTMAAKLQVQERLTNEIAAEVQLATESNDVAVVVKATHLCMISRGVRQPDSETVTSALQGAFYEDSSTRSEFYRLIGA